MYNGIPPHYDEIFRVRPEDARFFRACLAGKRRVLDIGCGTGKMTALFIAPVREITGIDLSPDMIAQAAATHARSGIRFEALDMTRIAGRFDPASFDGALCLGNTLVHLTEEERLRRFLADLRGILAPGGVSVIQILNYARINDQNIRELPVIDTPNLRFIRRYEPAGTLLRFLTRLEIKATGEVIDNAASLLPLRPEVLEKMLRTAGFAAVRMYGDFAGGPLRDDSFVTVAVGR